MGGGAGEECGLVGIGGGLVADVTQNAGGQARALGMRNRRYKGRRWKK
jgi:hypothetical protein